MSYRTVKRLLGETSLERKCRFLFGGGLLLLITGSFYFYAWLNSDLVYEQNKTTARMLVAPILIEKHWKAQAGEDAWLGSQELLERIDDMTTAMKAQALRHDDLKEYTWGLYKAGPAMTADPLSVEPDDRPGSGAGYKALDELVRDDGPREVVFIDDERNEYVYFARIDARGSCFACHQHHDPETIAEGDMLGMVRVALPLQSTNRALAWNNAILLATGIVTAFLAMVAAYAIVRYVIVKPVLHLKDVSDEIARGNLDLRADIHTGDEFEELSHAFNRMLRHLVTVQDELRAVNTNLDGKVDELAEVNLTLYEMNKLKDEFLATMSHELRTPLNSILGFSDVLAESGGLAEREQRYVGNIKTSGRQLMLLINDLLDLAKIESGKMDLHVVAFPIREVVERQTGQMAPMAAKKNIDLAVDLDDRVRTVEQDQRKLEQILNNLLSNAVKFTPEGGRVRVHVHLHDARTFDLVVEDSGIGIPLEDQATIFEKFRQGHTVPGQRDAMTREYGGTGLGLSIVKELCKLLGGEIKLESEFGKGSTFTARLPVNLESPEPRLGETFGDHGDDSGLTPGRLRKPWSTGDREDRDETAA